MDISMHKFVINGRLSKLPPGFRFRPDDREIVFEYLFKKTFKRPMNFTLLEIDSCNVDPWNLLGERDRESYFFMKKKQREENARETACGYWKEFKPEKEIKPLDNNNNDCPVKGMKRTFVYFLGKNPNGFITQWILEEFRLDYSKSTITPYIRHQDHSEEWMAIRVCTNIGGGDEEGYMDEAKHSSSSSSSTLSYNMNDESDGEEVIQSK